MSAQKPKLYEFAESCWANVAKIALTETGWKKDDVEWVSINLAEGKNFDPEFLKVNPKGTVPTLVIDGKTYDDSTTVVDQIIKRAPHPPQTSPGTSTTIIEEVHAESHDPNATLLMAISDKDREDKIAGIPKGFLGGRQKALDEFAPKAPAEFKDFLEAKQKGNKEFYEFYAGNPDQATKDKYYSQGKQLWESAGRVIRGPITESLKKNGGPFAAGKTPGEADFHIITWLARIITCVGVKPGSPASEAIPKLQDYTGGQEIDPVIGEYWDAWLSRDSFKSNNIH